LMSINPIATSSPFSHDSAPEPVQVAGRGA